MAPKTHDTPFRFRWILAIRDHSELPSVSRLLAYTLSTHMEANGGKCFPSLTTLATEARVDRRTVTRTLRDLEAKGWLRRTRSRRKEGDWARTVYTPTLPEGVGAGNPYRRGTEPPGVGAQDPKGRGVRTPLDVHIDEQTDEQTTGAAAGGGWPARAAELWREKVGAMTPGRIGRALSPHVAEHGEAEVEEVLTRYLAEESAKFVSLKAFGEKYLKWRNEKPSSGRRGPVVHDPTDTWDGPGGES